MILVTGGCGYIGSHVVQALTTLKEEVLVFDNLSTGEATHLLHHEPLVVGDITDQEALTNIFSTYPIDTVIHLAALVDAAASVREPKLYAAVNATGSYNIWQAAIKAGVKHFLYASSAAVYGNPQSQIPISEQTPCRPTNPYGMTKLDGENMLIQTCNKHKGNYAILRFFNVCGNEPTGKLGQNPNSRAITQRLFSVAIGQEPHLILSGHAYPTIDGTVTRDFIHVLDLVSAMILSLSHLRAYKDSYIVNLGTGISTSMLELHAIAEKVTGKTIPLTFAPPLPGDIIASLASYSLATKILGWQPTRDVSTMVTDAWTHYVQTH